MYCFIQTCYRLLGLLYSIYEKTFYEARVKPEMSANFQTTFLRYTPHLKLPVKRDELFADLCRQWDPIQNSQMKCTDSDTLTPLWPSPQMATPHYSPGGWPTWSKPGKWHKWAMQLFMSMWHYLQWLFTNMYICHLITYSCTKSIKMLWGLFLPLTNLLISLHQQSSVSLHQGTTFIHSNF